MRPTRLSPRPTRIPPSRASSPSTTRVLLRCTWTSTARRPRRSGLPQPTCSPRLQLYLGSAYVNDFNYLNRTYQVVVQADEQFRKSQEDIARLKVRNASGEMVPIGTVANFKYQTTPYRQPRYNLYPAADVLGSAAPGVSSGTAMNRMEEIAKASAASGLRHRMDGAVPPAEAAGHSDHRDLRGLRALCLPGARGAIRELEAAAGDRSDRADVPAGLGDGLELAGHADRHPRADRLRGVAWDWRRRTRS